MRYIIVLLFCCLCYQIGVASVADTGLVAYPASFQFSGFVGAIFNDSLTIVNNTDSPVTISLAETSTFATSEKYHQTLQSYSPGTALRSGDLTSLVKKLKPQLSGILLQEYSHEISTANVAAYTTIVNDERGDTTLGSVDVYRIEYQKRTVPVVGTYFDFRVVTKLLPDSNVVGVLSMDADQEFGTGLFPTPGGIGLTSRDIGSEFEILLDASGMIAETLGLGNIPIGIIYKTSDTSIAGIPLPLSIKRDSVFTITYSNVLASWFGDDDLNLNIGGVFLRLGSGLNPFPDFAPDVSHGTIGAEKPVSWIREDTTSFTIADAESLIVHVRALAAKPAGTYTMNIQVKSGGLPIQNIPVTLTTTTPPPAYISVTPRMITDTLVYGDTSNHTLTITNTGEGLLGYVILDTGSTSWATIRSPIGTIEQNDTVFSTIHLSTNGLSSNMHYSTLLRIYSNDADSGTIPIYLSLFVIQPPYPVIYVSPKNIIDTIHYGDSSFYSVTIANNGGAELTFNISDTASHPWLDFDLRSGTLFPGAGTTVTFRVQTGSLSAGALYQAHVLINSNDTTQPVVTVSLYILIKNEDSIIVEDGWNLLSLPLQLSSELLDDIFPSAESRAFHFNNGYLQSDSVKPYIGFWLKFPDAETIKVEGNSLSSDSISVRTGWNMIGALSDTILSSSIQTNPPDIIDSFFFSFSNSEGYQKATELLPSKGYWVKVKSSGKIIYLATEAGMRNR